MAAEQNYSPAEKDKHLDGISLLTIPPVERIICAILMEDLKNLKDRPAVEATRWWWRMQRKYGEPHTWNTINGGYNIREYQLGRNCMFTYVCRERRELLHAARQRVLSANPTAKDRKWLSDWETTLVNDLGVPPFAEIKVPGRATEKQHPNISNGNERVQRIPIRQPRPVRIPPRHSRQLRSNPYDDDGHERPVGDYWSDTPGAMMSVALSMAPENELEVDGRTQPLPSVSRSASTGQHSNRATSQYPHQRLTRSSTVTYTRDTRTAPEQRPQDHTSRGTQRDGPRTLGPRLSLSDKPLPPVLQASVEMGMEESQVRFLRQALEYCECQPNEIDSVEAAVRNALRNYQESRDK